MTSEEMLITKLPEGHWFKNIAKLGRKPNWIIVPKPGTREAAEITAEALNK